MSDDTIEVPAKYWFVKKLGNNEIRQIKFPPLRLNKDRKNGDVTLFGKRVLLSSKRLKTVPEGFDDVLWIADLNRPEWARKADFEAKWDEIASRRVAAAESLLGRFVFIEEQKDPAGNVRRSGLRPPQIG